MPCTSSKARKLLKEGKAKVVQRTPFTIQLAIVTGETLQLITLGVDSGYVHIGLSAISEKEELFSTDVQLRNDIVKLNSERSMYRRNRRGRKTRYRKARFLNRRIPKNWLAPSIQHKLDSHKKIIAKVKEILPISEVIIEIAAFDIQKIKNPIVKGKGYQNGDQKDFWNVREYVLYRDGHKCQAPKCNHKDPILNVHHIESRQVGGDRPNNLITLCETCHKKHHKGLIDIKVKASKGFKAETFMSIVRWGLVAETKSIPTFGYITKKRRIELELEKSHVNDAFVIARGDKQKRHESFSIKQVRKCNRKLFKGARSHIKNTVPRFIKGFQRYDKVMWKGVECFIFGRRSTGYFDLQKLDGSKIHSSAKSVDCTLLESTKSFLIEREGLTRY